MKQHPTVTAGQIFTLLFISRMALAMTYSVTVSGIASLWSFLLPLLLCIGLSMVLLVPVNLLFGNRRDSSVAELSVRHWGILGHAVPFLYALYFLGSCLYAVMTLKHFLTILLPKDIHVKAVLAVLLIACIYAALKGIEALSRMAAIVLGFILLSTVLAFIYLMPGFSSKNLLPVEGVTLWGMMDGTVFILSRMNSTAALPIFMPSVKGKLGKSTVLWSVLSFLLLFFMLVLFRGAIGDYLDTRELPVYQAIEGAGTLQRLNPFFIFVSMCSMFCHVAILLFAVSESAKPLFKNRFGKTICLVSGVMLLLLLLWMPDSEVLFNKYGWCALTVIFTFVIPLAVYLAMHRRTAKTVCCLLLAALFLTGCNSTQLNQRLIVQGIGIDQREDGYRITLIVLDTENEEKENAIRLVYTDGKTIQEAFGTLENQRGKKLLLSQCLFLMMSRQAADDNIHTLSYFSDSNEMQKTANLMVTEESAETILSTAVKKFGYSSEAINLLADSRAVNQTEVHCSLLDAENTEEAMLFPYVTENQDLSSLCVDGSYLVDKSGTHCLLNREETMGILIVNHRVMDFTDTVLVGKEAVSYQIHQIDSHVIPVWDTAYPAVRFVIQVQLDRSYETATRHAITESIRQKVRAAIDKTLLQNGCDVLSVRQYLGNAYPERYGAVADKKALLRHSSVHIEISI